MTEQRTRPRILVVQHQADCAPAWFGRWLDEAGCVLDVVRPWRSEPLPVDLTDHDGLLVLGGSMGAEDDAEVAWLAPVKELVRRAADADVPTLGICLGHQLVAVALGGRIAKNPAGQTVGLTDVGWTADAAEDPLVGAVAGSGGRRTAVHWNDDVVVVEPSGTTALARTADGALQVARFAASVWGVQLHPEADAAVVRPWAAGDVERHAARGVDQAQVIAAIADEEATLRATWSPVAHAFARLCGAPA